MLASGLTERDRSGEKMSEAKDLINENALGVGQS